jgi:hypothetical protein
MLSEYILFGFHQHITFIAILTKHSQFFWAINIKNVEPPTRKKLLQCANYIFWKLEQVLTSG